MPRRLPHVLVTVGAALVIGGTFSGWVQVGRRSRTSYELTALLQRLELAPDGPAAHVLRWWPLVPLIVVAASVSGWWGRRWWCASLALLGALYAGGVGAIVLAAPVTVRTGPPLTVAGAVLMAAGAVVLLSPLAARGRSAHRALVPDESAALLRPPVPGTRRVDGRR